MSNNRDHLAGRLTFQLEFFIEGHVSVDCGRLFHFLQFSSYFWHLDHVCVWNLKCGYISAIGVWVVHIVQAV